MFIQNSNVIIAPSGRESVSGRFFSVTKNLTAYQSNISAIRFTNGASAGRTNLNLWFLETNMQVGTTGGMWFYRRTLSVDMNNSSISLWFDGYGGQAGNNVGAGNWYNSGSYVEYRMTNGTGSTSTTSVVIWGMATNWNNITVTYP